MALHLAVVAVAALTAPPADDVTPGFSTSGFPISNISAPASVIDAVNATPAGVARDHAATNDLLLPAMQQLFARPGFAMPVDKGDISFQKTFPDTEVDTSCSHNIKALSPTADVESESGTSLKFGITNISWHGATVFADARVVADLDVNTGVRVQTGFHEPFHHSHCVEIARKTVGIDVKSDGDVGVGMNVTAFNARIARVNGTLSLVFNIHASVVGTVLKWNVEKVTANNCKIKILGIEIFSVCGLIEKYVKEGASKLTSEVMSVDAPRLLQKLQDKINAKIGDEIVIPLRNL